MTFIQPHKHHSLFNIILGVLVLVLLMGTFWLVVLYNRVVDLNHDIASDKAKLDAVGAENTVLSNETMAAVGSEELASLVSSEGLVAENKPQYFQEAAQPSEAVAVK